MVRHNLKLVLRNLWNNRIYSFVILLSLTVSFVCSGILIAFLVHEISTDKFHTKQERIFQVFSDDPFMGKGKISFIPKLFTDYLMATYPEVENVCQLNSVPDAIIEKEGISFQDLIILSADSAFLSFFDFPLIHGRRNTSLSAGNIILSKKTADVIFGGTDVVGQPVTIRTADTTMQLTVSAVTDGHADNSHLTFDAVVHPSVLAGKWYGGVSYVLLHETNGHEQLKKKIDEDAQRPGLMGPGKARYFFDPLPAAYFNADNKAEFMKTRSPVFIKVAYVVCSFILFISGFNFINLFLLFGQNRKKEIGIKKTLGITPRGLFAFSVVEAAVYIFISCLVAILATGFLLPIFNVLFDSSISAIYFLRMSVLVPLAVVLFISGAVVVGIAVLKQWRMKPISQMAKDSSKVRFNRLLFTFQFVISITLAICSITIIQQIDHIENAPLGFNRNLIQLNAPGFKFSESLPALKQKVALLPDVNSVTISGGNPISGNVVVRLNLDDGRFYSPYLFGGDEDFLKTLHLELIQGHFPSIESKGNLVNETLVRQFDLASPIGQKTPGTQGLIVGVVKDFTIGSFKEQIPPVIISYYDNGRALLVDYSGNDVSRLIPQLEKEWRSVFPDNIFDYQIMHVDLMKKHKDDIFLFKIVISFSIISIVLSCFGLFALSWAVIQNRTKEIGVRKVMGATSIDILNLLTLSFIKRIGLAFLIAAPVGYYLMDHWLAGFVNRISLNGWIFVSSALIMILVSALTLSIQTVKATMTNPVDEIRTNSE